MGTERGFSRIGQAIMTFAQPFLQMEAWMTEMSDAIARIEANLSSVTDEIGQVTQVLTDLAARVPDPGTTDELNSIADRLQAAKDQLEGATTLDDPAPEPPAEEPSVEEAPPAEEAPVEPPPVDESGDMPPASGEPPAEEAPAEGDLGDMPPAAEVPAEEPPA